MKKRYAICGLSLRGIHHFALPILGLSKGEGANNFSDATELVGILDVDEERVRQFQDCQQTDIPFFRADQFALMCQEVRPDVVLVAGPDFTHCRYIIEALQRGCDVIVEKPMVISVRQAEELLEAERKSGRRVQVTFNYRYTPAHRMIKRLLLDGRIGRITNVELVWNLDTHHGASYFYRWNRERAKSGGLNIHKCCHHFDLVNWWLGDVPETVFGFGALNYYGAQGANRPRDEQGNPFDTAETKRRCPYFQQHYADKLSPDSSAINPGWDAMDLGYSVQYPEDTSRYIYDDVIDIEDTYSVVMKYRQGATLAYSCNFSTPWEGYVLGINGTKGRLEVSHYSNPDPTGSVPSGKIPAKIKILPLFGGEEEIALPATSGGHGGADHVIQKDLFLGASKESQELSLLAGSREGALAVAQGEAVLRSIETKKAMAIQNFAPL